MFYGILVSIFFEDNERHHLSHIHVRYQGMKASVSIEDGAVLAGSIPPKQIKMVQVWVDIHKDELLANWELAILLNSGDTILNCRSVAYIICRESSLRLTFM